MRILIAPDKFKGSLSGQQVAENIAVGIRDVLPDAELDISPVADGGEGTAEVIRRARGGEWVTCAAHDALHREIQACYLFKSDTRTAILEMSEAAGIARILPHDRAPLHANTFGVGEMMRDAAARGAQEIVVALGGSATNDGGFGIARALGFRFFADDEELIGGPDELLKLTHIKPPHELRLPSVIGAADVTNPLLGTRGASRLFGAQKGATPDQIELLERALTRLADVAAHDLHCDWREAAGAGAAGGLGYGLLTFCGATLRAGFDLVSEAIRLHDRVQGADVVITGEGRLDEQTREGKAPAGVARVARAAGKPVFAIVGTTEITGSEMFDAVLVLARAPIEASQATPRAAELLQERARELARMIK